MGDVDVAMRLLMLGSQAVVDQVATRIYPVQAPDDVTLPAVVYQVISDVPSYVNGNDSCFRRMRYQTDSYAGSLKRARSLDEALRTRLSGWSGSIHGHTMAVFRVNSYPATYEAEGLWRVTSDYAVSVSS